MAHLLAIFLLQLLARGLEKSTDDIVTLNVPEIIVSPGKNGVIQVNVTVKKGYHIQANKVQDEFIIPTTLEITASDIIATDNQLFPAAKKFRLEGTKDHLLVYDGNFKIKVPFRTKEKLEKGEYKLGATLHYQACDNKTCFFPKGIDFTISLHVI